MTSIEQDLAAYYDQDAADRSERALDGHREQLREDFVDLLLAESRRTVVEVGTGPGIDAAALQNRGLAVCGVDLSAEHVRLARERGIEAHVGSVLNLPFADRSIDAGWTMSTLMHVPDVDIDAALRELVRVLAPGAPLAIGVWGGPDVETRSDRDVLDPPRFFSLRSPDRWHATLRAHGAIERAETWGQDRADEWTYLWCLLRVP
jgi:SAM-dependent methyltransferase